MNRFAVVLTTVDTIDAARQMAGTLVEQRLVACVNILPQIESIYRWQGKVERAQEFLLVMKTRREHLPQLQASLRTLHPYELPECIALEITDGSPEYLRWIADNTSRERRLPATILHADWSKRAEGRWFARAEMRDGRYQLAPPQPVEMEVLRAQLSSPSPDGLLALFDFPLGLPDAYARQVLAPEQDFFSFLTKLPQGTWREFSTPAKRADLGLQRPFYDASGRGSRREHLVQALNLSDWKQLLRECERVSGASPLFWLCGPSQVGKAALHGWDELLRPLRSDGRIQVWPFDGPFDTLLADPRPIVAESYPSRYAERIWGTARTEHEQRRRLKQWVAANTEPVPEVERYLGTKIFANDDALDAFVGLCGAIDILASGGPDEPADPLHRNVEGWIFGVKCPQGPAPGPR